MSMSRQNYEMVAGVLHQQIDNVRVIRAIEEDNGLDENLVSNAVARSIQTTAYNLAQKFKADNPRFDHLRFYVAAGFIVTDNYPLVFEGLEV